MKDTVNKGDIFGFDVFKAMRLLGVIFTYLIFWIGALFVNLYSV